MTETLTAPPPRPPLWRNVRFRRVVGQAIFVALLVIVFREIWLNIQFNADARNEGLGFDFLNLQAGFDIGGGTDFMASDSVSDAFFKVGLPNTLAVSGLGIIFASILGLFLGIARLSPNWLVRKIAQTYVDVIRNTPVAVQVVFWWGAAFLAFPRIDSSLSLLNVAYFSVKGMAVPWFRLEDGSTTWGLFLVAGLVAAFAVWVWRTRFHERTGRPARRFSSALGALILTAVVGYLVSGTPTSGDVPVIDGTNYEGGVWFRPEFMALLIALVIYTAAFIAEIIRGSIQAVSKGQHEAAEALGLRRGQQLRFVILPQALRIALPAINSQYLNLMKNSSLGVLIGFPELTRVAKSIITGRGHTLQVLFLLMLTYLVISLVISLVMNIVNRGVTTKGVR
jgi:general L-amino acid transport system permease protein